MYTHIYFKYFFQSEERLAENLSSVTTWLTVDDYFSLVKTPDRKIWSKHTTKKSEDSEGGRFSTFWLLADGTGSPKSKRLLARGKIGLKRATSEVEYSLILKRFRIATKGLLGAPHPHIPNGSATKTVHTQDVLDSTCCPGRV